MIWGCIGIIGYISRASCHGLIVSGSRAIQQTLGRLMPLTLGTQGLGFRVREGHRADRLCWELSSFFVVAFGEN